MLLFFGVSGDALHPNALQPFNQHTQILGSAVPGAECCSSHAAAESPALRTFAITTSHLLSVDDLEGG